MRVHKKIIIPFLILIIGYLNAQKSYFLDNGMEVVFDKNAKLKGAEIDIILKKPACYMEMVENEVLKKIMPVYSKALTGKSLEVTANEKMITLTFKEPEIIAVTDFTSQVIGNFNLPNTVESQTLSKQIVDAITIKESSKPGANKIAHQTYFSSYPRPNMARFYNNLNINLIAGNIRKYMTVETAKIVVKGNDLNKNDFINNMNVFMKKYNIKKTTEPCKSIAEPPSPIKAYQANRTLNNAIELLMMQQVQGVTPEKLQALKEQLKDDFTYYTFDDNAFIQITKMIETGVVEQTVSAENDNVTISLSNAASEKKLKNFLDNLQNICKTNGIDYNKFNIFLSGNPHGVYQLFSNSLTYYNETGQKVDNPFIIRMVTDRTGKDIINDYYAKVAGKNNLKDVRNIRAYYKMIFNDNDVDIGAEILSELPYKRSKKIFFKNKNIATDVFDGKIGYTLNGNTKIENYNPQKIEEVLSETSVFPELSYRNENISVIGVVEEADAKTYYKLKVKFKDHIVYEYYNEGNNYLYHKEFRDLKDNLYKTIDYINYTEIKGFIVPNTILIKDKLNSNDLLLGLRAMEINSLIEPNDFTINIDNIVRDRIELANKMKELAPIDEKFQLVARIVNTENDAIAWRKELILKGFFHARYQKEENGGYAVIYQGYEKEIEANEALEKVKDENPMAKIRPFQKLVE